MRPPYTLSPRILRLCTEIALLVGQYEGLRFPTPKPELRRKNRIKSLLSSLAIEGNRLTPDQVSAILENKRVIGPAREILEVQNAIRLYEHANEYDVFSQKSLLLAHQCLMKELIPDAGRWRSSGIGVFEGNRVIHMAPPADRVPRLIEELFEYLKARREENFLVVSAVLHYEIEFIHPFSDGNGRMGRFWQHLYLITHYPFFEYIPFESLIKKHQKRYYQSLKNSDRSGDSRPFIEFCLEAIRQSLAEFLEELKPEPMTGKSRLQLAKNHFEKRSFSRKDYLTFFKTVSTATASRDLAQGVQEKRLGKTGDKALARYRFR